MTARASDRMGWQVGRSIASRFGDEIPVFIIGVLIVLVVAATTVASHASLGVQTLGISLRQSVILALAAMGQSVVILSGGIDMSVGSNAKVASLAASLLLAQPGLAPLGIPAGIGVGALIGLVNGLLVVKSRAAPFIVTLAMFAVLRGAALTLSTSAVTGLPDWVGGLYSAKIGPLPLPVLAAALLAALLWLFLTRTRPGRNIYAIGDRKEVARLAGIGVERLTVMAYVICGTFAAMAGLLSVAQSGLGSPDIGDNLEFASITAVVVGGISLFGGRGHLLGALGGAVLLTLIIGLLSVLGINAFYQELVQGAIIVLAVAVYKPQRAR